MNDPTRPQFSDPATRAVSVPPAYPMPPAGGATPPLDGPAGSGGGVFGGGPAGPEQATRNPLRTIWRRKWIALACMIVGMGVGYVLYALTPPVYEGRARILVSQSGPKVVQQDFGGTFASGAMWLNTQCEIITVSVRWPEPEDAARLANLVVDEYIQFNDQLKKTSAGEIAKVVSAAREKNDQLLQQKYGDRLQFQQKNAGFSFNREVRNPVLERVNAISASLTSAELRAVGLQAEYDTIAVAVNDPAKVRQLLMNPQYRGDSFAMRRELRDMQTAIEALSATYGAGNTRLSARLQEIQRTEKEIEAEEKATAQAILSEVGRRLAAAKQEIDTYRTWLADEQSQVLMVNRSQAEFDLIEAEINRLERYNEQLGDQLKSINLAESAGAMNVHVVESAKRSDLPVLPDRMRSLFYGAIAGLMVGVGLAMLREFTDTRMRSADDIKNVLGLTIMGIVPHIQTGRTQSDRGTVVHHEPMSDVAESYRTVRTALYFGAGGGSVRTLLITSPAPGDGKTTLASNLAIAMTQAGNRVVLLDCDFRKPTQHRIFQLDKRHGLSNVLAGELTLEQAIQHPKAIPGLSVVPCGPIPANPSEILNSQGFADVLAKLSEQYDQVLIDSAPVLPVTDSRILAASCDAVILAVRAEKTTRPAATLAREHLLSVGGRVLGVVVNDVPRRKGVYGYYYADEGRYGYYGHRPGRRRDGAVGGPNGSPKSSNGAANADEPVAS
jgi:polysaccharide biosynthesis transport protein